MRISNHIECISIYSIMIPLEIVLKNKGQSISKDD